MLTDTAGSDPVETELVRRSTIDPATFIGRGKAAELARVVEALDVDVVVFDDDLTPAQQRNLQKLFGCDVVDRQAVILDIFAQHATSRAGALQVELALLRYHLPRLRGRGVELSRLGGGIGTRGPGETKLETDRRRIQTRIATLKRELRNLGETRRTQRKARRRAGVPVVALVGYTNAGKSTLLNRLTDAGVLTEDQLFSTLDSTVRRLELPEGPPVLISDTVGFVRRLPHELVEAFKSTLEEVRDADLLLHLVDTSDPDPEGQIAAVRGVLTDIGAADVPELLVLNKIDIAPLPVVERLRNVHPDAVAVSAVTGAGTDELLTEVAHHLRARSVFVQLLVPYEHGDITAAAHRLGEVLSRRDEAEGTILDVRLPPETLGPFEDYRLR